ncbi:MAG: NERD domain-containing protein, partial [Lachnospiraceae bacterium]|nr:NERD domain-containing protein [Lachnospiraceae bacterium]
SNVLDDIMTSKNIETAGGYQAKVTGDTGELELSSVLKSLPDYYHIIDNVMLKTKKGTTQIDHIIVSPFGIFVVETKNHKGMIFGDTYGQVWTQVLRNGHFLIYNPIKQNEGHIKHLSNAIKIPANYMQGVIVFTNRNADLRNIDCPWCFNIDMLYEFITSFNRQIFNGKQMRQIIERIDKVNIDGYINRQKHVNYVNSIKNRRGY